MLVVRNVWPLAVNAQSIAQAISFPLTWTVTISMRRCFRTQADHLRALDGDGQLDVGVAEALVGYDHDEARRRPSRRLPGTARRPPVRIAAMRDDDAGRCGHDEAGAARPLA